MATAELRKLRHNYKVAYTSYLHCVQELSEASAKGECPPDAVLSGEEKALTDLTAARRVLLEALCRHRSVEVP
jgi:hypothetical protein